MLLTVTHVIDPRPPLLQVLDIALQAEQVAQQRMADTPLTYYSRVCRLLTSLQAT